eukprot:TRINITY_DN4125_c0_g1_i1.p1 TRINITY_DN4125_c0_g1~~TRINITY_DN4125_c0_g1_i1.p1  ORF type:complete len:1046 (-),score=195.55 TRINITY_DN4125_c0_g1_i1:795-3932(-)
MEQLKTLGREFALGAQSSWSSSKDFLDLVKAIGEAKSKAEEDRIVTGEIETLKKRIAEPDVPKRKMKEYIIRLVYVEMLGHDASFGYIHAVKMTHDDSLLLKKTGYLAVTLFLDDSHDLIILIVNTMQKDMKSDNLLVVCAALGAVCKLINEETIPAVLPQVVDLLQHPKEMVRKKAVMALHRFYQRSPSSVSHVIHKFRQVLCDKDPSVMSAALCALYDLVGAEPGSYKNLVPSLVSILKQVAESRLPSAYSYHKTPAPFVQIKLLKMLALLGANDLVSSEQMYGVLAEILRRSDSGINIGNAILYEACCTATSIAPNSKLIASCTEVTSRFLKSDSHNLKYMGIDALGRVVKTNPDFANEHQLAVIDCLEDPDDTLKRKTLDLLYKMTSSSNVEVIAERMIAYMGSVQDAHGKLEIASKIIELAERYAPTNQWFIQSMNSVFELAGDLVRPKVAHDLMRLIAEGSGGDGDDSDADTRLRSSAVESYLRLLEEPKLPSTLLQVICWVLGEYGTADGTHSPADIISRLCDVAEGHSSDDTVRGYAITAITKVVSFQIASGQPWKLMPEARSLVEEMLASHSTDLQQRAYELQSLMGLGAATVAAVLPMDASCEDIEVDKNLHFLDSFVKEALDRGCQPYLPASHRVTNGGLGSLVTSSNMSTSGAEAPAGPSLRFEAYERPTVPTASNSRALVAVGGVGSSSRSGGGAEAPIPGRSGGTADFLPSRSGANDAASAAYPGGQAADGRSSEADGVQLRLNGVQKKWGRQTYGPASAATSSSTGSNSAASGAGRGGAGPGSEAPPPPPTRAAGLARPDPPVSEEKQRLAASLFGGARGSTAAAGTSSSGAETGAGRGRTAPSRTAASAASGQSSAKAGGGGGAAHERQTGASQPAAPPRPPPPDLLDFSNDDEGLPPPGRPAVDPMKSQMEALMMLDVPPPTAPAPSLSTPLSPSASSAGEGASLLNGSASSSATHQAVDGLKGVRPALAAAGRGVGGVVAAGAGGVGGMKGGPLNASSALQKDAVVRQAGVVPGGQNAELFKDIMSG